MLYLEKYWKYRKFEWRFFDSHSTKHLAKRKNEIGLTVYELKTEMWKKKNISPQNEITMVKPWNHTSKVVVSIFIWLLNLCWKEKNENIQIWSRYSLLKNTGCRLPASSSAALRYINWSPLSAAHMRQWTGLALVQIMACRLIGAKPLTKPMLGYFQLDA